MKPEQRLEQRLEQLECKCRNHRRVLTGVVMAVAAVALVAAAPKPGREPVQTEKLEIVDANGKVRIRLGPADEGFGIVVYDENGRFRATLTDAPRGAAMSISKGGGSINLMAMEKGSGITIRDQDGKPRTLLLLKEDGATIMLKDQKGTTVFSAPK